MSRIFATVALAAVMLLAFAPSAHAIPAAWFAAAGLSTFWSSVAAAVANAVIVAVASTLFTPKISNDVGARQADVTRLSLGEQPREAIFGRVATGGTLLDAYNFGDTNEWETLVIALADHPIEAIEGFYVNDKFYTFDPVNAAHPSFYDNGQPCLDVRQFYGATDAPLPDTLRRDSAGQWTTDDRLIGVSGVAVSYAISQTVFPGGRPTFRWVVKGGRWYDPRKDDTVPGGAGPQRWEDPTTWTWTENAAICEANYTWGVRNQGQLLVGPGRSFDELPREDVIARANLCDEVITNRDGSTEPKYRVGAVVRANERWIDIREKFALAMGGELVDRQGVMVAEPGAAQSLAAVFTDDDLLVGHETTYATEEARDRLVNTVTANFPDPTQLWNTASIAPRRSEADIAEDTEPRELPMNLEFVPFERQAQRIAEIWRRKARLKRMAGVTLGPRFMLVESGDWIGWQSQRRFGGATVAFRVEQGMNDPQGRVQLSLREIAAFCYGWNADDDELPRTRPAYVPAGAPPLLQVQDLQAFAATVPGAAGATTPAIRLTWTPLDTPGLAGLLAEIRRVGDAAARTQRLADAAAGEALLAEGLAHDVDYEVRLTPITTVERRVEPSGWRPVRTDALTILDVQLLTAQPRADGVNLAWLASGQPEVIGYDVRVSANPASTWEDAAIVEQRVPGSALFAPLAVDADRTFLVRAVDRQNRRSVTPARVTSRVVAPADVVEFQAAPNGDLIRFTWSPVAGVGMEYEIRSGLDWQTGRVVDRPTGASTTVQWPIRAEADALFWIKAKSAAGLYAATARLTIAAQAPIPDRNVIVARDYRAESWPGVKHDLTEVSGPGGLLELDRVGEASRLYGDYYADFSLAQSFHARTWADLRAASVLSESLTWDDADFAWDDAGDLTWERELGDAGAARLEAFFASKAEAAATLVEGFRFDGDLDGVISATPAVAIGAAFADCKSAQGVVSGAGFTLQYALSAPTAFSLLVDVRPTGAQGGDVAIVTLTAAAGAWLQVWRDDATGFIWLEGDDGVKDHVAAPFDAGDVVSIGVWQSATHRGLSVATRRDPIVRSVTMAIAEAFAFDAIAVGGPGAGAALTWDDAAFAWDDAAAEVAWDALATTVGARPRQARAVFGDLEVHGGAAVGAAFPATWARRAPTGYEPFRELLPGDYRFQDALVWLRLTAPSPVGQTLAITEATLHVDVPDVIDRGAAELVAGANVVPFNREFYAAPEVVAQQIGGTRRAVAVVSARTPENFTVTLFDADDADVAVAGSISYAAVGY